MLMLVFHMYLPSEYNGLAESEYSFSFCEQDEKGRLRACFMAPIITHIASFSAVNKKALSVYVHGLPQQLPQMKIQPTEVSFGRAAFGNRAGIGMLINCMSLYPIGYHIYYNETNSAVIEYLYFGEVDSESEEEAKNSIAIEEALKVIPPYQSAYLTRLL